MGGLLSAIFSAAGQAAGAAIMGAAAREAADAQKSAYKRQALVAKTSAYAEDRRLKRLRRIKLRRMTEAVGASGIRGDIGTPLDAMIDTSAQLEMDEINVRRTGIYAYESFRAAARNAERAGKLAIGGIAVSGVFGTVGSPSGATLLGGIGRKSPTPVKNANSFSKIRRVR